MPAVGTTAETCRFGEIAYRLNPHGSALPSWALCLAVMLICLKQSLDSRIVIRAVSTRFAFYAKSDAFQRGDLEVPPMGGVCAHSMENNVGVEAKPNLQHVKCFWLEEGCGYSCHVQKSRVLRPKQVVTGCDIRCVLATLTQIDGRRPRWYIW